MNHHGGEETATDGMLPVAKRGSESEVSPRIIEPDQALEVNGRAHGAVFKVSKPTKTADPCAPAEYCRSALPIHSAACIGLDRVS